MPSPSLIGYFWWVDQLRERRRAPDWQPEGDREILARLEDLYYLLDEAEREQVEVQSGRAWPDGVFMNRDSFAKSDDANSDEEDNG